MQTKVCTKCGKDKDIEDFGVKSSAKDGRKSRCKECRNEDNRTYRHATPEKQKAREQAYRKNNRDKVRKAKREYVAKRRKTDTAYRIKKDMRSRIIHALNGLNKSASTMALIGCSIPKLKQHLQITAIANGYSDFNIDDYSGAEYHVDHIKPCASFDLSKEEEQRKCFHHSNLQILTAHENLEKSDKLL